MAQVTLPGGHLFVCYSHDDRPALDKEVTWLREQGYTVWFDDGIHPGLEWADELAEAIDECALLLLLATDRAVNSRNCRNEIAYASDIGKPILTVFLEPLELTGGLKLSLLRQQAIVRWQLNLDEYQHQLRFAIDQCIANEAGESPGTTSARRIFQVPLSRNHTFSGRSDNLAWIESEFADGDTIALTGPAGIGKSQIALEYVYRHTAHASLVAWIRAEDQATLDADFVHLAVELGLTDRSNADTQLIIESVRRWLADHANWFLVLDNVENPASLRKYLPTERRGKLLVTSRSQAWGRFAKKQAVDLFEVADAISFLLKRTSQNDAGSAAELAETLGYLPLALEEAAAYIEATGRTLASYISLFRDHHDELMNLSSAPDDYPGTLRTTLEMTLKRVNEERPLALELLTALAFFAPDDIPLDTLANLQLEGAEISELQLDACLTSLNNYSLIKVDADCVSIHRLSQLVLRDRHPPKQSQIAEQVLRLLTSHFPHETGVGDAMAKGRRILPHALAVLEHTRHFDVAPSVFASLLNRTGNFLSARNEPAEANRYLSEAYDLLHGNQDQLPLFARTCELYGRVSYATGELDRAKSLINQAITLFEDEGEAGKSHFMQIHIDSAWIEWTRGAFQDSMDAANTTLALIEEQGGPSDPRRMASTSILSRINLELGHIGAARDLLEESTSAISSLGGMRSPLLCAVFLQVAIVLRNLGAPLRAKSWAQQSLALGQPVFSEHHSVMGASHCVLGQTLFDIGDFETAEQEFLAATECCDKVTHPINQDVVVGLSMLAIAMLKQKETEAAERFILDRMTALEDLIAGESTLALSYKNLALCRLDEAKGQFDSALERAARADIQIVQRYGDNHIYRLTPLLAKADLERVTGQREPALATHNTALEICQESGLEDHPLRGHHLLGLAQVYRDSNDETMAQELNEAAVGILEACLGPSSPIVLELQDGED